ncbi:hypothetical protein EDC96DRAFT_602503 [Choanephora cucurbitarum]|nr:hypothetical protein EDC96DRAFT_602503 [Choanephora cucurbitarum]
MSANQAPNHIPPLPQMIAQYQQQVEFFNNQIGLIRRNLERTDISNDEKESLRKQEQEIQSKVSMLQSIINQMVTQRVLSQQQQQQQQQQIGSPSSQQTGDNMSVNSAPGSPATFNPQQQQQQQQFAAAQLRKYIIQTIK